MEFRRSGTRDERRRRVLIEEAKEASGVDDTASEGARTSGEAGGATYGEAAKDERQPRITTLLPRRKLTLVLLALLGASMLAGLEALYGTVFSTTAQENRAQLGALDLAQSNSLGGWLSTVLLFAAAQIAAVIFSLRRHRLDDFRGRYRVWACAAVVLVLASLESAVGLRYFAAERLHAALGVNVPGGAAFWRFAVLGVLGSLAALRLGFEMRSNRVATGLLACAVISYASGTAVVAAGVVPAGTLSVMTRHGALLGGHMLLLLALLVYGRRVYLEAQGLVTVKPKAKRQRKPKAERKPKVTKKAASAAASSAAGDSPAGADKEAESDKTNSRRANTTRLRVDAAHTAAASGQAAEAAAPARTGAAAGGNTAQAKATLRVPAQPESLDGDDDDEGDDTSGDRRLSKAERRKMKKEQRRQQRV